MKGEQFPSFFCATRIIVGSGAHREVTPLLAGLGSDRVFMVVDNALANGAASDSLREAAASLKISVSVFSGVEPDPSDATVAKAFDQAREHGATAVIAFGGGSTIRQGCRHSCHQWRPDT